VVERPRLSVDQGRTAARANVTSVAKRELLDALPRGLAAALARRDALIEEIWREGQRIFFHARAESGRLFGRYSRDPRDEIRYAYELTARRTVGAKGYLRAPAVLEQGPGWLLESAVEPEPCRGAYAVDTVVAAASALADLRLPEPPPELSSDGRWRKRLRTVLRIRSLPFGYTDYRLARHLLASCPLAQVTSHGDFRPENVLLQGGAAWVVDWEEAGRRPAGYDLMQFWAELERGVDRERLFASTLELVGIRRRRELERLRFAVVITGLAERAPVPAAGAPDRAEERRLQTLVQEARAGADLPVRR
jgi:hypothetical protein